MDVEGVRGGGLLSNYSSVALAHVACGREGNGLGLPQSIDPIRTMY